jgi:hypothetical protein
MEAGAQIRRAGPEDMAFLGKGIPRPDASVFSPLQGPKLGSSVASSNSSNMGGYSPWAVSVPSSSSAGPIPWQQPPAVASGWPSAAEWSKSVGGPHLPGSGAAPMTSSGAAPWSSSPAPWTSSPAPFASSGAPFAPSDGPSKREPGIPAGAESATAPLDLRAQDDSDSDEED